MAYDRGLVISAAVIVLVLAVAASAHIGPRGHRSMLFFVEDDSGGPEVDADCAAKITYPDSVVRKNLTEVKDVYDYLDPFTFVITQRKGFYLLDVQSGYEEIIIACLSADEQRVASRTIIASESPCDVSGEFIVC